MLSPTIGIDYVIAMEVLIFDLIHKDIDHFLAEQFGDFPIQFRKLSTLQDFPHSLRGRKYSGVIMILDQISEVHYKFISHFRDIDDETPIILLLTTPVVGKKQPTSQNQSDFVRIETVLLSEIDNLWTKKYIYKLFDDFELELARRPVLQAIESSGESIVLTDVYGTITYVNPTFTEVTGYSAAEAIGKTPRLWKSGSHSKEFYEQIWKEILAGHKWSGELINRKKSGEDYYSRLSISPIKGPQQQLLGFAAIHTDITQFKIAEKELMAARSQALSGAKNKMQFLSSLSHELRTPLNAIFGTLELLKETCLSDEQGKHYDVLRMASSRLLRTISDLLELAAIEESKLTISKVAFSPEAETKKTISLFKNLANQKKIKLLLNIQREVPDYIEGDPNRFGQVLANLLSNGIKYSPGGTIQVDLRILQSKFLRSLVIKVIDNGIGINKTQQRKLFTRFSKLSEDRSELNGSGLGLAISKDLAELMGGKVGYEAHKPKGSVFWFSVPFEVTMKNISVTFHKEATKEKPRIMVVEDDELSGRVLRGILQNMGYEVILIEDSQNVPNIMQNSEVQFVFMDCMMPVINGYECTRLLRDGGFEKPIIGMSANVTPFNRDQCRISGMNDFIAKPIELKELQRCLHTWLHSSGSEIDSRSSLSDVPTDTNEVVIQHLKMLTEATSKKATQEIITLFLKNTPPKISTLNTAIDEANFTTIELVAHQLKSSCGYLGLNLLQDTFEKLEQAATKKESIELEKLKKALEIHYSKYSAFLNCYITPKKERRSLCTTS